MNVKRKKVLITGGSRGIGRACVSLFTKKNCDVVFFYRENTDMANRVCSETGAHAVKCDISDPESVYFGVKEAKEHLGGFDILVNNAGVAQFSLFTEITNDDWQRIINTNLGGTFYVTREVLPSMISQKSGSIINISSMWGQTGASCEVHYSASKAGIIGLTKALAKEVGLSGIRVNCVAPGAVNTDMNATLDESAIKEICNETPLSRIGTAQDIANAVYFLAGEKASFITGEVISVNGGMVI
ncbi:MAG: 3-oxoacyl-ACP reductase FabG [Clostridia bacterium]|nr:3-oxoacyl-ACP reductase FabG [Clostridia bacterium]